MEEQDEEQNRYTEAVPMRGEGARQRRQELGLSLADVALEVGRSITWVHRAERGLAAPTREDAERVAEVLDAPVDELFSRVRGVEAA